MAGSYTTISGDTWDGIAKKVYGSESQAGFLMERNRELIETWRFDAGVKINTPDLPEERDGLMPPWKYEANV